MSKRSRSTSSKKSRKTQTSYQPLEPKRMLASVGWDGAGLGSAELTYYIGDAPADIGQETFENVIEQALDVWSEVIDVTFTQTEFSRQNDSLDITFQRIDGEGGTLAQAYFPDDVNRGRIAGDIQFDSSESWEVGNELGSQATDLLQVAVHEIGHALGLEHSEVEGAVLEATVSPNQFFTALDDDDRDAALALYAPAVVNVVPPVSDTEVPVDETPVDETPEAETPVDETDTPAEETPVDDTDTTDDEVPTDTDDDNTDEEDDDDDDDDSEQNDRRNSFNRFFRRFRFFNFFNRGFFRFS